MGASRLFYFNPRSPHRERQVQSLFAATNLLFQSPLPSQGATSAVKKSYMIISNFNPRSPHRERPAAASSVISTIMISIHAPLTGSDTLRHSLEAMEHIFQSTLPSQGATVRSASFAHFTTFQSTLPSQGATLRVITVDTLIVNFNPRSPHRERHFLKPFLGKGR